MGNVYIKFTDDNSDSLTHYGVKGMKWGKHLKAKLLDSLENRLLDKEREFDTKVSANASSSALERSIAKTALKTRDEAKRRKTLKYKASNAFSKASNSVLNTKNKAISKGKGVFDKMRNKSESPNRKTFDSAANATKKAVASEQIKDAVYNVQYHKPKTVAYTTKSHYQTGVRGTPRKKVTTYKQYTVYRGSKGLAELARDSRTNKKEKRKRSKYSRG